MTIRLIDVGEEANDETGDTLRDGGIIINENFAELDTRTAAAQTKAEQGVADAAAAKAKADAAVPSAALGVSVAQLVSGKVPVPQLPEFVEPVAGKGLSSNDFTTTEKTKLSTLVNPASYGVGGPAPFIDNIYQIKDGGITYWNQSTTGRPPSGVQGNLISMTGGQNGSASTFIATSLNEEKVFFSRVNGETRSPWKQFLLAGDQGIGGNGIPVPGGDLNNARTFGNYAVVPTDLNGKDVYGFLEVVPYNGDNILQRLTTTGGNSTGDVTWFRTAAGDSWITWRRYVNSGNYGVGSDPRTGAAQEKVGAINDANALMPGGTYLVHAETANSPKVYGTFRMEWYDENGWTQTITEIATGRVWTRGCINGSIQPWGRNFTETVSNANGTATKFPDGTMICRCARKDSGAANLAIPANLFMSSGIAFTWPVPFVGEAPIIAHSSETTAVTLGWSVINVPPTLTGISDVRLIAPSTGAVSKISVIALGRWK
ncbi:pyocin knob domain-containing protein [Pseudomonas protegens]|uniref:pyocin knob domain-containing protein n=1 Tax=Pseudomonas protegens TaxID=380021 RepID=UPI003821EDDB